MMESLVEKIRKGLVRMWKIFVRRLSMATCQVCGGSGKTLMGKCSFCKGGQRFSA